MKSTFALLSIIVALLWTSCDNDNSPVPVKGDYLPVAVGDRFFLRESLMVPDLTETFSFDTVRIGYASDTVIAGRNYHQLDLVSYYQSEAEPFEVRSHYKFFRKEGTKYIQPAYGDEEEEHIFLDTEKPVGRSWTYHNASGDGRTTYSIKAINAVKTVNGIRYEDVIEVEAKFHYKTLAGHYTLMSIATSYFARGEGEIYTLTRWFGYDGASRISAIE